MSSAVPLPRWQLRPREVLLIILFWTSLATLSAVNRLLDPRGYGMRLISPAGPILLTYLEYWLWAAVTPAVFWLTHRVSRSPWAMRVLILLAAGLVVAVALFFIVEVARDQVFDFQPAPNRRGPPPGMLAPFRELGRMRFLNQFLIYLAVLAAGFAREYFVRDQARARQAVELQSQLTQARIDALRMQLNPHFLFNTLHAVSALVERDPSGVRKMIARLSDLLRRTMDSDAPNEVSLRDELAFLRRYIDIMEIRFQGRLKIEMDVADDALDAVVPSLILQPIVENAFEHGASRAAGEGLVAICAQRRGGALHLTVRDNGPGVSASAGSGVGVANTRARLAQLYGDAASLTLRSNDQGAGAIAELTLPFRSEVADV